jgi:hypothetical protein
MVQDLYTDELRQKRKKPCDEEAIKQVDATGSTHEAKV